MVGQVHSSFLIYYTIKLTHTHTASLAAQHVQADVVQPLSTHTLVSLALRHVQAEVLLAVGKHILQLLLYYRNNCCNGVYYNDHSQIDPNLTIGQ